MLRQQQLHSSLARATLSKKNKIKYIYIPQNFKRNALKEQKNKREIQTQGIHRLEDPDGQCKNNPSLRGGAQPLLLLQAANELRERRDCV